MNKKNDTPKENVMYVRLSRYYINYLTTRYGNPVLFPAMIPISQYVDRFLVNNPTMCRLTPFSFSNAAFHHKEQNPLFTINAYLPDKEERSEFVAIVIPDEVYRNGSVVNTSNTWQLSAPGAVQFRKQVKRDFWIAFSQFYDDCMHRAQRLGDKVTIENAITDFISIYNIEMKEFENMVRYWGRLRNQMQNEIEKRRDRLEAQTGNVFVYTV